jgi:predicted RNA-binding Zn ribbon-like protein
MDALAHVGGAHCLDLVATLRRRYVEPRELLNTPQDLEAWFVSAGLWEARGKESANCSAADLQSALLLRESIFNLLSARLAARPAAAADLKLINAAACRPSLPPKIKSGSDGALVVASDLPEDGSEAASMTLSLIAREAIELLGSRRFESVKRCAQDKCSLFFVDVSQGQRRRWCSMGRCGNLSKLANYRGKSAESA